MKTIAAAALMILAMTARAKEREMAGEVFLNGNAFYAICTSATEMGRMECLNYVEGIFDAAAEEVSSTTSIGLAFTVQLRISDGVIHRG